MAQVMKRKLSASTNGRAIKVAATSTPGTTLHTAYATDTTAGHFDEIWLWAVNSDTSTRKLTIEFGGTSAPDDTIEQTVSPESGLVLIVPGLILQNATVVRAFAASANLVLMHGFVNLMSP